MTWGWLRKLLKWAAPVVADAAKGVIVKKLGTKEKRDDPSS